MKKEDLPKISIVIPVLNMEKYIGRTIESIIFQKYPNIEVIIEDGASSDMTLQIIKKYARKHPKIIRWESKKDKGQYDALRKGFNKATGKIFTFINGDDYYEKNALLTVGKFWSNNPNTRWLVGRGRVVDESGREYAKLITLYKNILLSLNRISCLLLVNYVMQPSAFLSKSAYKKYGPFTGDRVHLREYDLWYRLAKDGMPVVLDKYISNYSLFPGTGSTIYYSSIVLKDDYETTKTYTNNKLIIFLRLLHNWGRVVVYKIFYNHK
jgi:glycosyltransferase involved in cell wall biosynthesis